ncbi:HNH endonuclease [Arenicellales bacterium nBUS_45]
MADWNQEECRLIVSDYMEMLGLELQGQKYNKAARRKNLLPKLNNRSEGSIEFKHQNISAVLKEAGLQWINGYKPASNYQSALKEVVLDAIPKTPFPLSLLPVGLNEIANDITQEHLLQAIEDFKNGLEHRFGPSSTYDVLHDGKRYPPKAIVGLAAKQILDSPLDPDDFPGGLGTRCFKVLTDNGFTIVPKEGRGFSGAWIFQGNPKRFDVDAYLSEFDYVYWNASQHKENIQVGDTAYIWRAGSDAGVVAIGEVVEAPIPAGEVKHPSALAGDLWADLAEDTQSLKIGLSIREKRVTEEEAMVSRESLLKHPTLAGANIIRIPRQTIFQLSKEEAMALSHLWATQNSSLDGGGQSEGSVRLRRHYSRERSGKLREQKKADYLRTNAKLNCEVCGFIFSENYPSELAGDYIEVHHIIPISELQEQTRTTLDDLLLVCSNCHRMIHRTRDAGSNLNQLRKHFKLKNTMKSMD